MQEKYQMHKLTEKQKDLLKEVINRYQVIMERKRGKYGRDWAESELLYLKDNYEDKSIDILCKFLSRSKNSIAKKVSRIGLKYTGWTQRELDFLYKFYNKISNKEIAEIIGKSETSIAHKLSELGLKKTTEGLSLIFKNANKNYATGKRSHLWRGGVSNQKSLFYARSYWKNIRNEIIKKDKWCYICEGKQDLIVHHKHFKSDGGNEEEVVLR